MRPSIVVCLTWLSFSLNHGWAAEPPVKPDAAPAVPAAKSVEQLAESAKKSVVVITFAGRDGKRQGLGTGFVVAADGLIATNLHVIGEGRAIAVQLADGKKYDVKTIHASDRALDLALLKIEAKDLPALELGDSDKLKQGQAVVALGNPLGLEHSIVAGVVSGKRELDGRPMIQVAIPLEQGNSGGPLLDMQGRVQGILTLKSLVTANLGFAMPVNALKPLTKKPNPIAMQHWLTMGALDPDEWEPLFEARWRQRAGRIQVEGAGKGFGGRSLCLTKRPVPAIPYELAVTVKMDDEAGAAGLVFGGDGSDKHYGFYPSAGNLRLTRFDGPDVYSWKVIEQKPSQHYRPGDWNTLKVRVEKDKIKCYVNDHLVTQLADPEFPGSRVGLAKFRETQAEFKQFQVAKEIAVKRLSPEIVKKITKSVDTMPAQGPPKPELVDSLLPDGPAGVAALRDRARQLEQQAGKLRELAAAVHQKQVIGELSKALQGKEDAIDLLHAALLVAKLDNEELDVDAYRQEVERMAKKLAAGLPKNADHKAKLAALNQFLFSERGFHGSRTDYYHKSNSYINEVIDDREGLPITLSVLYIELARHIGLKVVGVSQPGHFVVQHVPDKGEPQFIDVFEGGQFFSRKEAEQRVVELTGQPFKAEYLAPATKQSIILRMLTNLEGLARRDKDAPAMLRYVEAKVAIAPDLPEERWLRALLRYNTGQRQGAIEDADWLLERRPKGIKIDQVIEFRQMLNRPER